MPSSNLGGETASLAYTPFDQESPAIFNYAVGSSIDLVKAMKTVREQPIVAAIRVGDDFAGLKNVSLFYISYD